MTQRRLPVKQLVILSICRFAEPIANTSVFPYLPEMIESFGVPENDIARWAGLTSSIFSVCQCMTGIPWGVASDKFGRKPIILLGLANTMVMMLIWGFSTSLPMAITARAIQGLGNGNIGILRTTVAELCPWKELQPRAFSIMPLVYTIGSVLGPTLGGALSNPLGQDPQKPRGDKFLERYPYCLPNLVAAAIFTVGITTGWLFLKESLEIKKHHQDLGLRIGNKITRFVRITYSRMTGKPSKYDREREPLLNGSQDPIHRKSIDDEESAPADGAEVIEIEESVSMRDLLTKQVVLNLVVYTLLALFSIAYDQLLPVFMHHPTQNLHNPNVSLPLKFAGGFGWNSSQIGLMFTILGICCMFFQFFLFPPITTHLGVLRCLRISFLIYACVFIATPFTALLPTLLSRQICMAALMIIRGFAGTFAFPTSTILITNSASSLRTLGTLNGIATSVSAVGRAAGPAIGGGVFTMGVKHGFIIAPFWILASIAVLAAVPTLYLVEGKGFGDDPDSDADSVLSASAQAPVDQEDPKSDPVPTLAAHVDDATTESEYGEPTGLLSRTNTVSSVAMETDDEDEFPWGSASNRPSQPERQRRATNSSLGPRQRMMRRKSSIPIGMGGGFRRLSSNLGASGLPGSSWGG